MSSLDEVGKALVRVFNPRTRRSWIARLLRRKSLTGGAVLSIEAAARLRLANALLVIAALLALGLFVVSWRRDAALLQQNAAGKSGLRHTAPSVRGDVRAQVGDLVASFGAAGVNGNREQVVYDGRTRYLLFFFSPNCASCEREFPGWNRIAQQARVHNYRVLGLAIQGPGNETSRTASLTFPVVMMDNEAILRAYRVETIPMVVMTSPYGRVEWLNYGPMTDAGIQELLSTLVITQASPTDW